MAWYNWWVKPPPRQPLPTLLDRRKAPDHIARYDLAIKQADQLVANGEKPSSRLDQLHRELAHWLNVRV